MYGFGFQYGKISGGSVGYGSRVDAIIARANDLSLTVPSDATLLAYQTMFESIGDTALAKMDVFHTYSPDAGTMGFFTLNAVAPSTFQASLVNAPTESKLGITTDGSTDYIDSGFDPNDGSYFTLNDNHIQIFITQDSPTGASVLLGVRDASVVPAVELDISTFTSIDRDYSSNNGSGNYVSGSDGSAGLKTNNRTVSTEFIVYQNGAAGATHTDDSESIPNKGNVFLGGLNLNGSIAQHSVQRIVGFSAGAGLTTTEMSAIKTAMETFYGR